MVIIKLSDKKYSLPTQSSEVNTGTFLKLQEAFNTYDEFDNFDLLEIITGIDRTDLVGLDSSKDIDTMLEGTAFIFEMMEELKGSKRREYRRSTGEVIQLPKDFANMNFGQRIALNTLSQKYEKDKKEADFVIGCIAIMVAPYLYIDEDWTKRTDELQEEIELLPVLDTIPIFNFFLNSSFSLRRIIKNWLYSLPILSRFKQA
jgi:hypothetical protein